MSECFKDIFTQYSDFLFAVACNGTYSRTDLVKFLSDSTSRIPLHALPTAPLPYVEQ